jgi:hypothetical protein
MASEVSNAMALRVRKGTGRPWLPISLGYLSNGFNKAQLMTFLKPVIGSLGPTKVVVSTFKPGEPVSEVDGYLGSARGRIPITYLFGHVVREDGKWLWYGNQQAE